MQFVGIFNDVCYLATLVLAGILLRDSWRDFQGVSAPASNIRIPLIFALSFYLPFQLVWILLQCAAVRVAAVGMAAAGSGDGRRAVSPPGDSRNSVVFPALAGTAGLPALARAAGLV